jgi:hypothetical protein
MLFKPRNEPTEPVRPSHFREDPNQRTDLNEATLDYPDTDLTPDSPEDYGWQDDPPQSVPVYLTEAPPSDRSVVDWSAGTYTAGTTSAVQVGAAGDRGRRRVVVRNLDNTNAVYALRESTHQNFSGFKIPAGASEEFLHNHAIWIRAETANVEVSVFAEFDVEELEDTING